MNSKNQGFTLIEALIYLALFAVIIGGISMVAYALVESTGSSQTRISIQEEAGFLLGKLDWALTGAQTITVTASTLTVNKYNFGGSNPLIFDLNAGKVRLKTASAAAVNLNNDDITVSVLSFTDIPAAAGKPQGVTASFTVQKPSPRGEVISQSFVTTKYLRQ